MDRRKIISHILFFLSPLSRLFPGGFEAFLLQKRREGREEHPLFRGLFFLYHLHTALTLRISGLFIKSLFCSTSCRFREMRDRSPLFPIAAQNIPFFSPWARFLLSEAYFYARYGHNMQQEDFLVSPVFDQKRYLAAYKDVKEKGINPFYHYITAGYREKRESFAFLPLPLEKEEYQKKCCAMLEKLKVVDLPADSLLQYPPFSPEKEKKIAIHLHCYYPEKLPLFIHFFRNIPQSFDLYLSLREGENGESFREYVKNELPFMKEFFWEVVPNRGRDVAPLLCNFGEKLSSYDIFCHLHTKKSPHNRKLAAWMDTILQTLLGSPEKVKGILAMLEKEAKIIYPAMLPGMEPDPLTFWGGNFSLAGPLLAKAGKDIKEYPIIDFPHGNMFWAKGEYLRPLLALGLAGSDFPEEPIKEDGTLAHVLEHIQLILTEEVPGKACCLHQKLSATPPHSLHEAPKL